VGESGRADDLHRLEPQRVGDAVERALPGTAQGTCPAGDVECQFGLAVCLVQQHGDDRAVIEAVEFDLRPTTLAPKLPGGR
jgi:hypothetical protein